MSLMSSYILTKKKENVGKHCHAPANSVRVSLLPPYPYPSPSPTARRSGSQSVHEAMSVALEVYSSSSTCSITGGTLPVSLAAAGAGESTAGACSVVELLHRMVGYVLTEPSAAALLAAAPSAADERPDLAESLLKVFIFYGPIGVQGGQCCWLMVTAAPVNRPAVHSASWGGIEWRTLSRLAGWKL